MNLLTLINQLMSDEGIKLNAQGLAYAYQDTKGVWTIGYGTTYIETPAGVLKVSKNWKPITKRLAKKWLYANLSDAIDQAIRFVNNFHRLNDLKQMAIVNMCYQMGTRVKTFKKARQAIQSELWGIAYKELLDSKWAKIDSPNRANRVARAFIS